MRSHIEVESKLELSEVDFKHVLTDGRVKRCVEQINIYYDQNWTLAAKAATFRVRLASGAAPVVTFKSPAAAGAGYRVTREWEFPLSQLFAVGNARATSRREISVRSQIPSDMGEALLALGVQQLSRVGWVRNRRYVVEFGGAGSVELDWLRLPGGQQVFEVEIENDDTAAREHLVALIRCLAPRALPSEISKFERFRRAALAQRRAA